LTLTIRSAASKTSSALSTTRPPGTLVLLVREAATLAHSGLDVDFVAVVDELHHGVGLHRDPTLLVFDLLRNPYDTGHACSSFRSTVLYL
jgi:hypothetical protein